MIHFTHCGLQKPSLSITEVSAKMNHLLSTLTAEGSDESAQEFYYSCLHDSRTMEDGGLRLEPPPVPKGWKRAKCNESARQLRRRIVGLRAHSDTEIADYYVKKLQEIFQAVINAFGQRFTIPPVLSTMEDYLGIYVLYLLMFYNFLN